MRTPGGPHTRRETPPPAPFPKVGHDSPTGLPGSPPTNGSTPPRTFSTPRRCFCRDLVFPATFGRPVPHHNDTSRRATVLNPLLHCLAPACSWVLQKVGKVFLSTSGLLKDEPPTSLFSPSMVSPPLLFFGFSPRKPFLTFQRGSL